MKAPEKISERTGRFFHLPGDNIDTDRIIPAVYLKCLSFTGLGEHVFADARKKENGNHPFDQPQNQGATMLLVDSNFASGSSREHAPHALRGWGIDTLLGRSFANIFRDNCTANGIICIDLDTESHETLRRVAAESLSYLLTVNIETMMVSVHNDISPIKVPCTMPDSDRDSLLNGTWDPMIGLLASAETIKHAANRLPYVTMLTD